MIDSARIEELKRRVQMDPASIAFAALAEEYRRAGQYEDAIAVCEAGLQRHPAYLSARVTLGRSFLELSRFDEARQQLEEVLRTAPENLAAIRALAEIHDRVGEYPDPPSSPSGSGAPAPAARTGTPGRISPIPLSRPAGSPAPVAAPPAPPAPAAAPSPPAPPLVPSPTLRSTPPLVPPPTLRSPTPLVPPPPPRVPHPDEAALPALEAFLTAIRAARAAPREPLE